MVSMALRHKFRDSHKSVDSVTNVEDLDFVKLVLVGDSGVGKSCLLDKFLDDSSTNNFISTVGVDIRSREIHVHGRKVKIQVWDMAGHQRYRPVLASCYRGAQGVIMVYDITNMISFVNIQQWIIEVEEFSSSSSIPRLLVGNKTDLKERREVKLDVAEEFAKKHKLAYIETSVMARKNVQEAFLELVKSAIVK